MSMSVQIVLLVLAQAFLPGSVVINEFMAANDSSLRDPQGQYDDWVELFNAGNHAVDVGGLHLTDNPLSPTKWRIPDDAPTLTTIAAGGHLILWLDKDADDAGLHATFSLDADGEEILAFRQRRRHPRSTAIAFGTAR